MPKYLETHFQSFLEKSEQKGRLTDDQVDALRMSFFAGVGGLMLALQEGGKVGFFAAEQEHNQYWNDRTGEEIF